MPKPNKVSNQDTQICRTVVSPVGEASEVLGPKYHRPGSDALGVTKIAWIAKIVKNNPIKS